MKKHIFYKRITLLILVLVSYTMQSQEIVTKKIEKTFKMTNAGELHLNNKYGNVIISGWEENKAAVVIDIKVNNKKKENAKALIDRIIADIKTAGDFVSITSTISEKNTSFFSRYFNKVNPFEFDKSNVEINYNVYLPINAEIDVTNMFGDIIIDNWTGKLKANLEHGDLWINDIVSNAKIDMKFGKLRAKSITYGTINLKNGDIDITKSKNLLLRTSGSNIDIDTVTNLELYSSKDEIAIEHVEDITGEIYFSKVTTQSIGDKISLLMRVAELRVSKINQPDAMVDINQESSDIHINITGLSFKFNATLEQGLLRLPKTFSNVKSKVINKSERLREITANYGSLKKGVFSFAGKKGVIVLNE
ncbi:hypothetical protein [Thalassobellus citreus]|uniref:hypothetical protein n=1 Tax=Thalassobellus citreus TaxID=3367752 RepID=UPI00378FA983